MPARTALTELLGIEHPLIQAPMAGGATLEQGRRGHALRDDWTYLDARIDQLERDLQRKLEKFIGAARLVLGLHSLV